MEEVGGYFYNGCKVRLCFVVIFLVGRFDALNIHSNKSIIMPNEGDFGGFIHK